MAKLGVIGCGNMGSALIQGVLRSGLFRPADLLAWDVNPKRLVGLARSFKIRRAHSNAEVAQRARALLLAVKPQQMGEVAREIRPYLRHRQLVISIAAGVPIRWLRQRLGAQARIVRVMPNTPALVGAGIAAISAGPGVSRKELLFARRIFEGVGEAVQVPEGAIDAVTAVSGSGPAYFFFLMEAMIEAGVGLGLSRAVAKRLVLTTAVGSGQMARATEEDPRRLRLRVTSRGGTTEAAFRLFEQRGLGNILRLGIRAAHRRAKKLANASSRAPKGRGIS